MRNIVLLSFIVFGFFKACAQDYYMATPQGFGAATTGGGNATPVTVSTYASLRSAIIASGPGVILVYGTITIPAGQPISAVVTNKSIIGLPGAKLVNETQSNPGAGILYLRQGSSNVILRNLIFTGPGAYDIDGQDNLTIDGCVNLWVDHCEFQDGQDGNFDLKGLTDNVTVSWCKFTYLKPAVCCGSGGSNDHRFSNLIGANASNAPADGHFSVTFQNCYWGEGCKERMPRARNAELHIVNCYYNTSVTGARAIGLGGGTNGTTCYVENTDFARITNVYSYYSGDGGSVGLKFSNCLNQRGVPDSGNVTPPPYTATVMPVEEVATRLTNATCGAGATLQVSASGQIIPATCTLNTDKKTGENFGMYTTTAGNVLNVRLPHNVSGKGYIIIYTTAGKEVINIAKDITAGSVSVDLDSLQAGTYICKVVAADKAFSNKFVKK